MKIRGTVISGPMRGAPLIHKHFARIIGVLGFRPYEGTLDIRLDDKIDMKPFSRKTLQFRMQDGYVQVDAYIARIGLKKISKSESINELKEEQKKLADNLDELIKKASVSTEIKRMEYGYECYAFQFESTEDRVMEIVAKDMLRKELSLEDGDVVEIEFLDDVQ